MPSFQQQLRLKKNWGNTYRANLRAAVEALPKFVPMPPLSILRALPSVPLDSAEYNRLRDEMQAAFDEANEAIDSVRAALVLLQATPDSEFEEEPSDVARAVEKLVATTWKWGESCGIDDVRDMKQTGDSYNEWHRSNTDAAKRELLALIATPTHQG